MAKVNLLGLLTLIVVIISLALMISVYHKVGKLMPSDKQESSGSSLEALVDEIRALEEVDAELKLLTPRLTLLTQEVVTQAVAAQIAIFEGASAGEILVEYPGLTLVYDPKTNSVVNMERAAQLPQDFLSRLVAHQEMQAYAQAQPLQVIIVNEETLPGLQQQLQGLTEANLGHFIIVYQDRLVVYDYTNDRIMLNEALQQQTGQ
jgi:hypothetical protein